MDINTPSKPLVLRDLGTSGQEAVQLETAVILMMAIVVTTIHFANPQHQIWDRDFVIPITALIAGIAGAAWAGPNAVGLVQNWRYVGIYTLTILCMIGVDLSVRMALGGDLAIVLSNWAVLIGSASAVNLFFTGIPGFNLRSLLSLDSVAQFQPIALIVILLVQIGQLWISVLGATLPVIMIQLLARRIAACIITDLIARLNYGSTATEQFLKNQTFEYAAVYAIADRNGEVIEPDPIIQTTIGKLLLSLPIFAGEPMTAGVKSLTRMGDKLLFVEQMLAFSSPSMVVNRYSAMGHIAFIRSMLHLRDEPIEQNPKLADQTVCLKAITNFSSSASM